MTSRHAAPSPVVPLLVLCACWLLAGPAAAQGPKSAALATELTKLMEEGKLDSIAADDPADPERFVGALFFPGLQLLVVSAKYTAPQLMVEKLQKRNYRDVYIDLNSASIPESKIFIEDLLADGVKSRPSGDEPADAIESGGKRIVFDGDRRKQNLSEQEYDQAFTAADEQYARMLSLLIAQVKKRG